MCFICLIFYVYFFMKCFLWLGFWLNCFLFVFVRFFFLLLWLRVFYFVRRQHQWHSGNSEGIRKSWSRLVGMNELRDGGGCGLGVGRALV